MTPVAIGFATARSFDVLNLLAHLLDQQLELEACIRQVLRNRLRAERVGLAVELLHQKVQALADRPSGPDHAVHLFEVRSQAVQLLGDVRLDAEERDLLADALLVRAAEDLAKARGQLFLVGGDRLGEPRLDRNEQRFEALGALEEHLAELFALARAPSGRRRVRRASAALRPRTAAARRGSRFAPCARPPPARRAALRSR